MSRWASFARVRDELNAREVQSLDVAVQELLTGNADALVFEATELRYRSANENAGQLRVLRRTFDQQQYGLAIPTASLLREPLNRSILRVLGSPEWQDDRRDLIGR